MPNPFSYGGIVAGKQFCNRIKEMNDLVRAGLNGEKLFIHGERRIGKTSLLRKVMTKFSEKKVISVLINVWKCVDATDFVNVCASGFAKAEGSESILKRVRKLFDGLYPAVTIGDDGKPSLTFERSAGKLSSGQLENVLKASWKIADSNRDKRLVVIFDEFQQVRLLGDDRIERLLRSVVQERSDISWFFCGSRAHLLKQMFLDSNSPLYRSAGHYPIEAIKDKHWIPFISGKFSSNGINIPSIVIKKLLDITSGHPFYTQMLCSSLWDICEPESTISDDMMEQALNTLLERENSTYHTLWDSLPEQSKRMLRAIAFENPLKSPYSGEVIGNYGFTSPSSAGRAIEYLTFHDLIIKSRGGGYITIDRFLGMWCRKNFAV
ncbi:MAG: ATP-binding protein [Candidatus Aegiribacteria sp.]|nr:ATP-binding protein [Candidatus Aegiribacteria sp.]